MRIANYAGRFILDTPAGPVDVHGASNGRFDSNIAGIYRQWGAFQAWADSYLSGEVAAVPSAVLTDVLSPERFGCPAPEPLQIFAVGLNYEKHAEESGLDVPAAPLTFTKFASSLTGPISELELSGAEVDWEVELVVVLGSGGRNIPISEAWEHVAGLTVGQDYSDRRMQFLLEPAQFSLAKSYAGYSPMGPWVITPDSVPNPNDLAMSCVVNGVTMQKGRTSEMNFSVAELIARLSTICELRAGDLIFTGTPDGVGQSRTPSLYLKPGDEVVTSIDGIGQLRQTCIEQRIDATASA